MHLYFIREFAISLSFAFLGSQCMFLIKKTYANKFQFASDLYVLASKNNCDHQIQKNL